MEKLASDDPKRGFLGGYKGAAGDWVGIVKAYETNLLYLAEAGLTLARNGEYELPYLKKQASKFQQQMSDFEKRKADALKSASLAAADHERYCMALGFSSVAKDTSNLDRYISLLTKDLYQKIDEVVDDKIRGGDLIQRAIQCYSAAANDQNPEILLPVLVEVKSGNMATWYPNVDSTLMQLTTGPDVSVDSRGASEEGAIAWDVEEITSDNNNDLNPGDADPVEVVWDIGVAAVGEEENDHSNTTLTLDQEVDEEKSNDDDEGSPTAIRLVLDKGYRAQLLDDLFELKAFLTRKSAELGKVSNYSRVDCLEIDPSLLPAVNGAIEVLTDEAIQRRILLKTSIRFKERFLHHLKVSMLQEDKFRRIGMEADIRKAEAQRELMSNTSKTALMVKKTRMVKETVQSVLGSQLHRRINIQGEINKLI